MPRQNHFLPLLLPLTLTLSALVANPVAAVAAPPEVSATPAAGAPPLLWKAVTRDMFDDHGKVTITKKTIQLGEGSPATGIRYLGPVPRGEYEIRCQAKRTGGGDFFYGLTFPVGQDYCSLIVGGWGGSAVGLSNVDGLSAIENSTTQYIEFEKNRWYTIRLRVAAGKIAAWVDEKQMFEIATEEHTFDIWWEQTPLRPLGIATWNTAAEIRDFKIIVIKKND